MTQDHSSEFEALIQHIKVHRGFDFTGYKRTSLRRRIEKRMQTLKLHDFENYIDYLEVHPGEYTYLFNTILINVTSFFRDTATWDFVRDEVLPLIIANNDKADTIRVWSAGCATGQEAYSIAMLLAEGLGSAGFNERVKIYATDLDDDALISARQANYSPKEVEDVPEPLLKKYFDLNNGVYTFNKDLRRSIIFGRHDLVQDAPISRVDLLICRNTLMYFNPETQEKILKRFSFALKPGGFLLLGKAEMLFSYASLFASFDLKRRIFTKTVKVGLRERLMSMNAASSDEDQGNLTRYIRFREIGFDHSPVAQIVVDLNGFLVMANERARSLLNLSPSDVSRMLQDLDVLYRIPELRTRIDEVQRERRLVVLKEVKWMTISGDVRHLEVQLAPLNDSNARLIGISVSFVDMTAQHQLQEEIESANQELETAYEELQSTNEELETTNEELQSTIEELETTNEELQSTNEELETINEELQSTNEELQTMNDEANSRSEELNRTRLFLESILGSMRGGVIVVNVDYNVQVWNHKAEDLWGLRDSEVIGKNFFSLDIGLPVEKLANPIRVCLSVDGEKQQLTLDAVNRRGKQIECYVTCTPLVGSSSEDIIGVILVMEAAENAVHSE
jgi:two-component system, chemotaxis family, CheB/CheR fusion protein